MKMDQFRENDDEKKTKQIDDKSKIDLSNTKTAPVDDENFLPPQLHDELGGEVKGDADGLQCLQSTLPVEDAFPFGDAFETQMVDFGNETQVMDIGDETQVVDLGGETHVLDDFDAEVQIDSDGKGSEKTEVLSDTEKLSDDDSVRKDGNCSIELDNTLDAGLSKQRIGGFKAQSGLLSNEGHHSGSIVRGFTEIRVASMRSYGLAARNMAIKRINSSSCPSPIKCDNSLEQQHAEKYETISSRDSPKLTNEFYQKYSLEEYDPQMKELGNVNTRKVSSSAVRKLFMDDVVPEVRQADDGMDSADGAGSVPQFASVQGLAVISHVDSQEPGDLSQANALDVVDKFIELNVVECDQDVIIKKSTAGVSKPVSCAKGTLSLAKKAAVRSTDEEKRIFNWDDDLEDEGGGEFFQKKKDLFFENVVQRQRSISQSRKPSCPNSKSSFTIQLKGDKEQADSNKKLKGAVLSDSKLLSKNFRANESPNLRKSSFKKNLLEDLDEEMNAATGERPVDAGTDKDLTDKMDVGFDTQLAADAMETLQLAVNVTVNDCNNLGEGVTRVRKSSYKDETDSRSSLEQRITRKRACSSNAEVVTRISEKGRTVVKSNTEFSLSSVKQSKNVRKQSDAEPRKNELERAKADLKDLVTDQSGNLLAVSKVVVQRKEDRVPVGSVRDKIDGSHVTTSAGGKSLKRHSLQEELVSLMPIAHQTRGSVKASNSKGENNLNSSRAWIDVGRLGDMNVRQIGQSHPDGYCDEKTFALDLPIGRRTRSKLPLFGQEASIQYNMRSRRSKSDATSTSTYPIGHLKDQSSVSESNGILADRIDNGSSVQKSSFHIQENVVKAQILKHSDVIRDTCTRSAEGEKVNGCEESSPKDRFKPSASASTTPRSCKKSSSAASPICMGDEYHKQSCRKNLLRSSLMKELDNISRTIGPEFTSAMKDTRRRGDMTTVRAMFSRHLDADITKQQKKILARLGSSVVSSISDATHFITDEFVHTRNMLEAIAFGKPVVTHLWLESCGQANCCVDERNYILRDARKEKEFGFRMPVSLARACQHPLLQGHRVLITPNTKPGKEVLGSLVKAVHGLAVERLGRSALKEERLPDDILVLSCEEDYEICVPFLEKGAAVYSSELLLNGIVTQRLEYERYHLFTDNIKRTRSTIRLKKSNNQYLPVNKSK